MGSYFISLFIFKVFAKSCFFFFRDSARAIGRHSSGPHNCSGDGARDQRTKKN